MKNKILIGVVTILLLIGFITGFMIGDKVTTEFYERLEEQLENQ